MVKTLKQLVHVLWVIEKDLHVIASNMEAKSKHENTLHQLMDDQVR